MEEQRNISVNMNFGEALQFLKNGHKVCRKGWNCKGMWLKLASETMFARHNGSPIYDNVEYGKLSVINDESAGWIIDDFIFMKTATNTFVPWLAGQTDILAEDWETL